MVQQGIKPLPVLIKLPNKTYTIGVHIYVYNKTENIAICIGYGKGINFTISQIFELKNKKELKASKYYIESLKSFFKCEIFIE